MPKHVSSHQESLFQQDKDNDFRHFAQGAVLSDLSNKALEKFAFRLRITPEQLRKEISLYKKGGFCDERV